MKESNVTIILPTFNEKNRDFYYLIEDLSTLDCPVIVTDDGTDNLEEWTKDYSNIKYIRGAGDEATSIHKAILQVETPFTCIMDADGSHSVISILEGIDYINSNPETDIINFSRYLKFGETKANTINKIISKIGNKLLSFLTGVKQTDWLGRYIFSRTALLKKYDVWYGKGDAGFAFLYQAHKDNKIIKELPFIFRLPADKQGGVTSNWTGLIKYGIRCTTRLILLRLESKVILSPKLIQQGLDKDPTGEKPLKVSVKTMVITLAILPITYLLTLTLRLPIPLAGLIIQQLPLSTSSFILRACYWKTRVNHMGYDVLIANNVTIWNAKNLTLKHSVRIDTNVILICNEDLTLNERVSIHQNTLLNSKGTILVEHDSCIGSNCALYASTNISQDVTGNKKSYSYASPRYDQEIKKIGIEIGHHCYVGTNSTIIGVTIGDYTIIGANSFLKERGILDNQILVGSPARMIKGNGIKV